MVESYWFKRSWLTVGLHSYLLLLQDVDSRVSFVRSMLGVIWNRSSKLILHSGDPCSASAPGEGTLPVGGDWCRNSSLILSNTNLKPSRKLRDALHLGFYM